VKSKQQKQPLIVQAIPFIVINILRQREFLRRTCALSSAKNQSMLGPM
jgi:hypothetical protein